MEALGRLVNASVGWAPVDQNTAAVTGKRVRIGRPANGVLFLVQLGAAGSGTEDITFDLQQHTASSSGTTADLDTVTRVFIKSATALDGTEAWVAQTQSAASEVTIAGATYATKQCIVAIEVYADQLSDGYGYVSLNCTDPGSVSRLGACIALQTDLMAQRDPASLPASLT